MASHTLTPLPKHMQWVMTLALVIIAFITYASVYEVSVFSDADSPWHLAAGDYIREIGRIPEKDPWAFTSFDATWYNISWMYDVAISYLNETFGMERLLIINMLFAAAIVGVIAYSCMVRGAGIFSTLIVVGVAIIMVRASLSLRPQQETMLLVALAFLHLHQAREKLDWKLWLLPVYTVIWVNIHGGFLVMYVMIGSFWLEALIQKDRERAWRLFWVGIACVAATLINPFTYHIIEATLRTLQSPLAEGYISEWRHPGLSTHPHIFLYIISLMALPFWKYVKLPFADALLMVFWAVMTLQAMRYNGIFLIFISPYFAMMLQYAFMKSKRVMRKEREVTVDLSKPSVILGVGIIGVVIVAVLWSDTMRAFMWREELLDKSKYPVEEINYLMEHFPHENIYNHYNYGGYIIYLGRGKIRPMIDGRADTAYSRDFIKEYLKLDNYKEGWEEVLDKYHLKVALLPNDYAPEYHLTRYGGWKEIFKGEVATVYRRK